MAFFRTRGSYRYREFTNCPRATFVDLYTHNPLICMLLGMLLAIVHGVVGILLYNASKPDGGILFAISSILLLAAFVWLLFGAIIIPKLSDHFDWAGRIAKRELRKLGISDEEQK